MLGSHLQKKRGGEEEASRNKVCGRVIKKLRWPCRAELPKVCLEVEPFHLYVDESLLWGVSGSVCIRRGVWEGRRVQVHL